MKFKRIIKYLFLVLLFIALGFLYGFTNARNNKKKITTIGVKFENREARFLTASMVNKLLIQKQDTLQNLAKSKVDLYHLEERLSSNPYIESATVYTTINGQFFATIKERVPIARILKDESSYYIDSKGFEIPLSQNFSARVPVVSGVFKKENIEEVYDLLLFMSKDKFLKKEITGINRKANGEYLFTVRSGIYIIDFGSKKNLENKFKKLKIFYSKTLTDKSIYNYKTINLKFHNQVVGIK